MRALFFTLLMCSVFTPLKAKQSKERPNIIFILTDDQQFDLLGINGNPYIQTPNLDQLAKEGVLMTNAHVATPICTPSRTSILLGQYERAHHVNFNSATAVSPAAWNTAYPMILREGGYFTGYIGKNHTPIGAAGYDSGILEESFDYYLSGHGHLSFYPKDRHPEIFKDAKADTQVEIIDEGVSDFFSNEFRLNKATEFIEARPKDQPFFLNVCFNLPHGASTSTMKLKPTDDEIYRTLYRDLDIKLDPLYIAKKHIKTPKLPADLLKAENRQKGYRYVDDVESCKERYIRQMQAVTGIDRMVGHLRATLKEQNLDQNTILVFTSDHGVFMGQFGLGGKALLYEVCTKVPMIIFNPMDKIDNQNHVNDQLVETIDLAPTFLSWAGIQAPGTYQGKDISKLYHQPNVPIREFTFTENLWSTQFGKSYAQKWCSGGRS